MPIIYAGEWILFLYVFLFVTVFNMAYYANTLLIDLPWEEPIVLPIVNSSLAVVGTGIVCFLYIKFLTGNRLYKKCKEVIWGLLFGANLVSCILWVVLSYPVGLSNSERTLLLIAIVVSSVLTIQVIRKFRNENKE
ncbi:hypothetical protein [Bacillus suaedae]|uniref:Uncharacterized protein n=1 Tax=Halalkalibacter suaedae TaxID=2822140 RepID=A0A940X071_9BACI|nr:hypothetical protein [Bacillus suaedae]MBP3951639.1 hypothetical protein [Bacillus suaedae]